MWRFSYRRQLKTISHIKLQNTYKKGLIYMYLIKTYYSISPTIVTLLHQCQRSLVKLLKIFYKFSPLLMELHMNLKI